MEKDHERLFFLHLNTKIAKDYYWNEHLAACFRVISHRVHPASVCSYG